ncbi:hypothetical protein ACIQAC_01480 [Streptomyces sp. NPDC088387]|uniref:hypothetical protein n=1 Tax=Streptomyces sp. NPDC088387 TaxID=3365859 RepID=UPI0037FFDBC8
MPGAGAVRPPADAPVAPSAGTEAGTLSGARVVDGAVWGPVVPVGPSAGGAGVSGGATVTVAAAVGPEDRGPLSFSGSWVVTATVMAAAAPAAMTAAATCPRGVSSTLRTAPLRAVIAAVSPPM